MKRKSAVSWVLFVSLCLLSACGGGAAKEPEFQSVVGAIDEAIGNTGDMIAMDADYIFGALKMDESTYAEGCVKINAYGANVDEYGVFRGEDAEQAKAIKQAIEAYFKFRVDTWMEAYMPEEKPKVISAELRTEGNYVCYAILDPEQKEAVFEAFGNCFK